MPSYTALAKKREESKVKDAAVEKNLQEALAAVIASGFKPGSTRHVLSINKAADDWHVSSSTLGARYKGRCTRAEVAVTQQKAAPAKEAKLSVYLAGWARRGLPMSPRVFEGVASNVLGMDITESWVRKFRARHPELRGTWTTGLEACRARALNHTTVDNYFKLLRETIDEFGIIPSNIYNMDEKGVQLGVANKERALVDRDQATVYKIEQGSKEMVTMIETVCADGSNLPPMAIFKGKTRDMEWGRYNPSGAAIGFSENGWSDNELGQLWLRDHFEPHTRTRNPSGGYRLLILDGHNSHCTYGFALFAELHKIIVICLPPHSTHVIQVCDVAVFGPLAGYWKKQVSELARAYTTISKRNILPYYQKAREQAMKPQTIISGFRKTGTWPIDPSQIPESAFGPALATTSQMSFPSATSTVSSQTESPSRVLAAAISAMTMPPRTQRNATRDSLLAHAATIRKTADESRALLEGTATEMALMEEENKRLRAQLYGREETRSRREGCSDARNLTCQQNLEELARSDWKIKWKKVLSQLKELHKQQRREEAAAVAAEEKAAKQAGQEEKRRKRDEEAKKKADGKAEKDAEKAAERERKQADAARKKEDATRKKEDAARKKEETARKKEETARKKEEAARKKEEAARKKEENARKKEGTAKAAPVASGGKRTVSDAQEPMSQGDAGVPAPRFRCGPLPRNFYTSGRKKYARLVEEDGDDAMDVDGGGEDARDMDVSEEEGEVGEKRTLDKAGDRAEMPLAKRLCRPVRRKARAPGVQTPADGHCTIDPALLALDQ
ncbi:unnamed protein product [Peniophora sp. CBMAI 1063]|nr:unnamed protein product [Peniophora sp. CBMAI 1063]